MRAPEKVGLTASFARIHEHWRPKVIAELNGQEVKLVDELFLIHRGGSGSNSATVSWSLGRAIAS